MNQQEVDDLRRAVQELRAQCKRQANMITMLEQRLLSLFSFEQYSTRESPGRRHTQN
jgi:hypothetical protein